MNLTLDALSSLLRGLNMLSLAVVAAPDGGDPGEAVGFQVPRDLFSLVPTRLFDSTAEEDGLVREKNVINFFLGKVTGAQVGDLTMKTPPLSSGSHGSNVQTLYTVEDTPPPTSPQNWRLT